MLDDEKIVMNQQNKSTKGENNKSISGSNVALATGNKKLFLVQISLRLANIRRTQTVVIDMQFTIHHFGCGDGGELNIQN